MNRYLLPLLILLFSFNASAQPSNDYRIIYRISKPYCILNFMETLRTNGYYGPSLHDYFKKSQFANDEKLIELVNRYKNLKVKYSYEFNGYPKYRYMAKKRSTRDLFYLFSAKTETLEDFKQNTVGLIPYYIHKELFNIFQQVEPIYDELIWEPYCNIANERLIGLQKYSQNIKLKKKLEEVANLFRSYWTNDIPLIVCFAIVPAEKIKLIPPPQGNVVFCNLLTESDNYSKYTGKIAHEFAHRAFTEQSLFSHRQLDKWLNKSLSPFRFVVNFMLNEVLGGAVGHKIQADIIGEHEFGYGQSTVKSLDKTIYPLVKSYMDNNKSIDNIFVENALQIYEETFPNANNEFYYLLQTYYLVTDVEDYPIHKLPGLIAKTLTSPMMYEIGNPVKDDKTINTMIEYDFTKLLIITKDHRETFDFLRNKIKQLKNYDKLNYNSDFVLSFHDECGKTYIIMNLQTIESFQSALERLKEIKTIDTVNSIITI